MIDALMVLGLVIFGALLIAGVIWGRAKSAIIFCPVREQVVEMKDEKCFTHEGDRSVLIGSIWECQRPCLDQPEVKS
jgi:hypothetical protein